MELLLPEKELTVRDLRAFEDKLKIFLPEEFKQFYLKWNGGVPTHSYFEGICIQVFAPIKYGDRTIEERYTKFRSSDFIPDKFIPFGNDGGSCPICIDLGDGSRGAIYLIPSDSDQVHFVSSSFQEFIEGLKEENTL